MTRQFDNVSSYLVTKSNSIGSWKYSVTLIRLKNTYAGNPRFKAILTNLDQLENYDYAGSHVYTFTGHYMDDVGEANFIVEHHLKKMEELYNK